MLVSQSLVFIHLTKCGGTFVRSALLEVDGPEKFAGRYHGPWSELPNQYRAMPVITAVRNPYDWWVSWYHYMKKTNWFNPIARAAVNSGNESFSDMLQFIVESLKNNTQAAALVDSEIQALKNASNVVHNDFTTHMIGYMRQQQCGVLSWRFAFQLYGLPETQLTILKQESLLDDLTTAMNRAGLTLENNQNQSLLNLPKVNVTQRKSNYREYYNEQSQAAVANLDKQILDRFDYQF